MLKKKHKILLGVLLLLIVILFAIPIIAKNYINNNGKELIGRTINLESLSLNYFTGRLNLEQLLIYEKNERDTFLFVSNFNINPNVISCIGGNYIIQDLEIIGLKCNTILIDTTFNFNSIITHFNSEKEIVEDTVQVKYAIEKISITNSYISYYDKNLGSKIALNNFNTYLPNGISWDNPRLNILSDFNFTTGGRVDSKFNFNVDNGLYDLHLNSEKINLSILFPYLKDMMLVKELTGELNTDLFIKGNTHESSDLDILGSFGVNDIIIRDTFNRKVMALAMLNIVTDSVNPAKDIYSLSAIKMEKPYVHFELYSETDNFSQLFKVADSTVVVVEDESESNVFVMIKDYVVETLEGIKASNFSIDTVAIINAEILYVDHTLLQPFKYTVSKTNLTAYNVTSNADSLKVRFSALLNNKGELFADGILHPKKPEDVNINFRINKMSMKDLSPYFHQYVAFPVTKGHYSMSSSLVVKDKQLLSNHKLFLEKFKLGKKQKHEEAYNVPLKMGVAMLKDRKGNIDMEIPIEGDLADPKYKIWKVVGKIFTELLVKAATSPYKLVAGGADEDATIKIKMSNLIAPFNQKNTTTLDRIAEVLKEKPELTLLIEPYYNLETESQKMAMNLAKSNYLEIANLDSLTTEEITKIDALNPKDSLFNYHISTFVLLGIKQQPMEQKVASMYNPKILKQKIEQHILNKNKALYKYLLNKEVKENQLKNLIEIPPFFNDKTTVKNVQFHLLFDLIDDDEISD